MVGLLGHCAKVPDVTNGLSQSRRYFYITLPLPNKSTRNSSHRFLYGNSTVSFEMQYVYSSYYWIYCAKGDLSGRDDTTAAL